MPNVISFPRNSHIRHRTHRLPPREYGDRLGFEDWLDTLQEEFLTDQEELQSEFRRVASREELRS